ncbi:piggyBac transposable element-derived protein 4-like [Rhopalosiphum padi]|uniref:piggyBac transposable element-derived protein 4-like n=1 Tax=Rhopalosiphum padi TaxID=40932 RepID=UPI00298E02BC|nr:piggyBac transposable element-derived protein 4-like [Rhopalosiphum padi]
MDKNCEKVCAWLSEVEDDYALFDSDDTDADSDFCIENVESDSDESTDQTTSNVRRRSPSLSAKIRANYQNKKDLRDTTKAEIDALLGLLYLAGYLRSNHLNLHNLWCTDGFAPEYFRAIMSEKLFSLLLRAVRFDDIETRNVRRAIDKLAPIRTVFDDFVRRCKANYTVGENCTIDEMLEGFRGRCSFRQYIPNKPNKYGIKIQALVYSRTFYTSNMEVYVGTQPDGPFKCDNSPSSIVKRLISPISKTGCNITMDNWYNSIPLANELLKNHNLTVMGTLRKNKREIPPVFLETKKREVNSTVWIWKRPFTYNLYSKQK